MAPTDNPPAAMLTVTFILRELADEFFTGRPGSMRGLDNMTDAERFGERPSTYPYGVPTMTIALYCLAAACAVLAPCALRMASHFARA